MTKRRIRNIGGETYYNMSACAELLNMSHQGWRNKVYRLNIEKHKFNIDEKGVYIKESDLLAMDNTRK